MRKFLLPGILAVFTLFLPPRSQAQPLDMPYQIYVSSTNTGSITLSTTNFPSPVSSVNANAASYQWCVNHVIVSAAPGSTFTMAWSSSTLTPATTDYQVVVSSTIILYDGQWPTHDAYCAPVGQIFLKIADTLSTAVITVQAFLWKGWNP